MRRPLLVQVPLTVFLKRIVHFVWGHPAVGRRGLSQPFEVCACFVLAVSSRTLTMRQSPLGPGLVRRLLPH
jgi:hypothetical protein